MPEDDYAVHINQMERDRQAQQAEYTKQAMIEDARVRIAEAEARKARWSHISASFGWLSAAAATIGISYITWQAVAGPSAQELLLQEDRHECMAHGGTWNYVPGSTTVVSCVMPGVSSK